MVTTLEPVVPVTLFGGMAAIHVPQRMQDISTFRPVPDHQEVYADGSSDQSVIVEILVRFAAVFAHSKQRPCSLQVCT
jgi:hypothetical protein